MKKKKLKKNSIEVNFPPPKAPEVLSIKGDLTQAEADKIGAAIIKKYPPNG